MLSKDAHKLLNWFCANDGWRTMEEISQSKKFSDRSLKALTKSNYVERSLDVDGECWVSYRISDLGLAYLDGAKLARASDIREWISFCLSVAAIVISIISMLMQAGIL